MNILITGSRGFIGKHLIQDLLPKYNIWAPGRSDLDLLDNEAIKNYLSTKSIDIVIHIATEHDNRSVENPKNILENNLRMYFNLISYQHIYFQRMIVFSSGAIYKQVNFKIPEFFFGLHIPEDTYGFSKWIISNYNKNKVDISELRLFGVFGPYENYNIRFISNAICKVIFDLPITIKQDRLMSYLWIEDLLNIIDQFITTEKYGAYNIVPRSFYSLSSIADKILRISGKSLPITISDSNKATSYIGNNNKLLKDFPNTSFTYMDVAIDKLYQYYYTNKNKINKQSLLVDK